MLWLDWQLAMAALLSFSVLFALFLRIVPEIHSHYARLFRAESELRTVQRLPDRHARGARFRTGGAESGTLLRSQPSNGAAGQSSTPLDRPWSW